MKRSSPVRLGFTLIELIAVVVILAILAGVALPTYFDHQAKARESAVRGTLGGVRAGVASFYANEAINGTAAYPTFVEFTGIGTVMQEVLPDNPYTTTTPKNNNVLDAVGTWVENPPALTVGGEAWAYDNAVGKFWANTLSVGEKDW